VEFVSLEGGPGEQKGRGAKIAQGRGDLMSKRHPRRFRRVARAASRSRFAIARVEDECAQLLDASWLTLGSIPGIAEPDAPFGVCNVDFDATSLPAGKCTQAPRQMRRIRGWPWFDTKCHLMDIAFA